jgi:glycosyltransferase involved in cell wall biosynthesis
MRLLLVDREFPPNPHGGIGSYNLALARCLGQRGHFVAVLSCTAGDAPTVTDEPYGLRICVPHRPPGGVLPRYLRWIDPVVLGLKLSPHAVRLTKHLAPDLLEVPSAGGYGYFLVRNIKDRLPVITRFHGVQGRVPIDDVARAALRTEMARVGYGSTRGLVAGALNSPLWKLEHGQLALSRQLTCPSQFARDWLHRRLRPANTPLPVIPNGLPMPAPPLPAAAAKVQPARPKVLTFVGRCTVPKGVTVLARAIPHILHHDPQTTVVLAGPLPDPRTAARLSALAHRYPGRITLAGRLPHPQLLRLLAASHLLLAPSFYEVCPMALLEAMALGLPAVASHTGPFPELVQDRVTGALFPVGDAHALAAAVVDLLHAPHTRLDMAEACRSRFAARYDIRVVVQQLERLYETVSTAPGSAALGTSRASR